MIQVYHRSYIKRVCLFLLVLRVFNNSLVSTLTLFLDPEKVERVKELYEDLLLPHTYEIYEEESYKIINTHIQQISRGLPHKLFYKILEKIYRRNS
jgi:hypothetical protein